MLEMGIWIGLFAMLLPPVFAMLALFKVGKDASQRGPRSPMTMKLEQDRLS